MAVDKSKLHLIATGDSNWDYYTAPQYADGSQAVLYVAKEGSGCDTGIFCGVKKLRAHFIHLQNVIHGSNWSSMIPNDWNVVDRAFFEALGIR